MSELSTHELSRIVNAEARDHYPNLVEMTGIQGLAAVLPTRLGLRMETLYPYKFTEADDFYPADDTEPSFGRVIRAARAEGLDAIHASIGERDTEHAWLHVPEAGLWIDSSLACQKASVEADIYLRSFLSRHFGSLEDVHTHPDRVIASLATEGFGRFTRNYLLEAAIPSGSDLLRAHQLEKRGGTNALVINNVVSHYGATTYSMTRELQQQEGFVFHAEQRPIIDVAADPATTIHRALGTAVVYALLPTTDGHDIDFDTKVPVFDFQFETLSIL